MRRSRAKLIQIMAFSVAMISVVLFSCSIYYRASYSGHNYVVYLQQGSITYAYWGFRDKDQQQESRDFWEDGFFAMRETAPLTRRWVMKGPRAVWFFFEIPLIWISLFSTALALVARRLGRSYPPGHCQKCGYDLTFNTSGLCPECAMPVPPKQSRDRKGAVEPPRIRKAAEVKDVSS